MKEKILVISADGKGIVMHPEGLREATRAASQRAERKQRTRLSPGGKGHRKRMATVVSVYEIEPYPEQPEERGSWVLDRAAAILRLRSLKVSGDLTDYMEFHFRQERQRNYPGPPVPDVIDEAARMIVMTSELCSL